MQKMPYRDHKTLTRFSSDVPTALQQLQQSQEMQVFSRNRAEKKAEKFHPFYHYVASTGHLHDPNGLCFWQGNWHLFYQHVYNPGTMEGREESTVFWGHLYSPDLIHWQELPDAIGPGLEPQCWSGAVMIEQDRALAAYFGRDQGIYVAYSDDPLLLNWTKVSEQPVIPIEGAPCPIFDPNIFKVGDTYYILSGRAEVDARINHLMRQEYLFSSKDLLHWKYEHPFLKNDRFWYKDDDGACPYFLPIGDAEDQRHLIIHFSHVAGPKWILGKFDIESMTFDAYAGGKFSSRCWKNGGIHAPSAFVNDDGEVIVIFNMNADGPAGEIPLMSLPHKLSLSGSAKDELDEDVAGDYSSLRGCYTKIEPTVLKAGQEMRFEGIGGDHVELQADIELQRTKGVELKVFCSPDAQEYTLIRVHKNSGYINADLVNEHHELWLENTVVTIDPARASLNPNTVVRPPEVCEVPLGPKEHVKLHIFLDKGVIEVFVNQKRALIHTAYPSRADSTGITLTALGADATLHSIEQWELQREE